MNETIKPLLTPVAIMVAGAFIGLGLYLSGGQSQNVATAPTPAPAQPTAEAPVEAGPQEALALELDENEFIYGNPDAEVFIVEYSDIDCPFCARVHPTLESIVDNSNGEIAWVYRHFPIEQLHPDATRKAMATECVGRLAGNDVYWEYLGDLIDQQPTSVHTNYGVSVAAFNECMEDPQIAQNVTDDVNRAVATGGRGTPHSIVSNREFGFAVSGAQPEAVWLQAVNAIQEFES